MKGKGLPMASQHITTNFFDCRYVWMISPHIPTTCQPALLAEVLTWVPLPPACQSNNGKLHAACGAVVVLSGAAATYVFNGPTYPP